MRPHDRIIRMMCCNNCDLNEFSGQRKPKKKKFYSDNAVGGQDEKSKTAEFLRL